MACNRCEKCGKKTREETHVETESTGETTESPAPTAPQTIVQHHYHRRPESASTWKYFFAFGLGWLFFGC